MDARKLDRLLATLKKFNVTKFSDGELTLELRPTLPALDIAAHAAAVSREPRDVDAFLKSRLGPARGAS